MIDNYCIMAKCSNTGKMYFVSGFKTLATMRKKYNNYVSNLKDKKHDKLFLVARNYDREIIKIYDHE